MAKDKKDEGLKIEHIVATDIATGAINSAKITNGVLMIPDDLKWSIDETKFANSTTMDSITISASIEPMVLRASANTIAGVRWYPTAAPVPEVTGPRWKFTEDVD